MSQTAEKLIANERALRDAWGDAIPPLTPELRADVDRATDRLLAPSASGSSTEVGTVGWAHGISPALLPALAAAYRDLKDEKCAQAARAIFTRGLEQAEAEMQAGGPGNILTIPHRLGDTEVLGWFGALPELAASVAFDREFVDRIVESGRIQLNHLVDRVHDGRNIRMTQCDALFTEGLRLAFLPDSARWRDVGLRGMNDAFFRQFHPDGASVEATGWYHYIVANMALRYLRLKRHRPDLGLQVTPEQVIASFDYLVALVQPDGQLTPIGDCSGYPFPHRTLESVLGMRAAIRREFGFLDAPPPRSQVFPDAGQAMLRDGWNPDSTYLTFDATHRAGYHWHPARNAIQLHFAGQAIIVDHGYMRETPAEGRLYACSTPGHSTMNLNGWNQSPSDASLRRRATEGYEIIDSLYDGGYWKPTDHGYAEGIFGEHHRTLLWIKGRFIVVIDNLYHTAEEGGKPTVENNWQFAPGQIEIDAAESSVRTRHGSSRMLILFALKPGEMEMSLHEGEEAPCRGWLAGPVPAPLLRLHVSAYDPWNVDLATILIPYREADEPPAVRVASVTDPARAGYGKLTLEWEDGSTDEIWWTRRLQFALDRIDDIRTDAALVHLQRSARGELLKAMVYDGSYLEPYTSEWRPARQTFTIPEVPA